MVELQLYIDQYIQGELEGELLDKFEKQLAIDTEFSKEVEFYRATQIALENKEKIKAFGELIPNLNPHKEEQEAKKIKPDWQIFSLQGVWMKAAAVVLILAVAIPIFFLIKPSTTEQHYAGYFTPYSPNESLGEGPLVSGSIEELSSEELWESASQAFKERNIEKAKKEFQLLLERAYQVDMAQIYIANCYLIELKPDSAKTLLIPLSRTGLYSPEITESATWYLALAYWELGQYDKSAESLKTITTSQDYGEKAKELIKKMSK